MSEAEYQKEWREKREKKQAALDALPQLPKGKEFWYVGADDEFYSIGQEKTREAALDVGRNDMDGDGFHIICARIDPVDVAAHFDINDFMESIDKKGDYLSGESYDSVFEACTQDQLDDLENRVRKVMREWQIECHAAGQVVMGDLFTNSHSGEWIMPEDEADQ